MKSIKKTVLLASMALFGTVFAPAQTYDKRGEIKAEHLPSLSAHYQQEYDYDEPVNTQAWNNCKGLNAAFGSTDNAYFRREVPADISTNFKLTVWRGEKASVQLLVWSSDTLEQVRFKVSDLTNGSGGIISAEKTELRLVRYVLSNYPFGDKGTQPGESSYKTGYMMPDRFEDFDRFDLPGHTARPVWLTIDVPAGTAPGSYKGTVEVKTTTSSSRLDLDVNVLNQTLPPPAEWKHRLDLWQNPWTVAWRNNLKPWSEEHKMLLKKHLKPYAEAGGSFITTYAVNHTWSGGSYWPEGGMIDWIKTKDGSWKFDYTIFDTWVQLAMDCGINEAITIYSPIPWNKYMYYDEDGNQQWGDWKVGSAVFKESWGAFLTDLKAHLKQKNWLDITYIGINENEMQQTLDAMKFIRQHSADWKITYAGDWHPELNEYLDDYCVIYLKEMSVEQVEARRKRGATTTYYVCTVPPLPNNFVFSPPIEGRWISWYSVAHKYDGFLRWAYDAWTFDPNRDARHTNFQAGDCFLVYPGGHSSIRMEKLREGIIDFEKIRILREKVTASSDPSVKKTLSELESHLKVFLDEKAFDETKIKKDVDKGKSLLNQLSEQLSK